MPDARSFSARRWALATALATLVLALTATPPFVSNGPRRVLMGLFWLACHQDPARSFMVGEVPFALCHRCTGIVVGLALGAFLLPIAMRTKGFAHPWPPQRGPLLLALAAVPAGADWALGVLGVWANTPGSRFATGLAFGVGAGLVLARTFAAVPERDGATASAAAAGGA